MLRLIAAPLALALGGCPPKAVPTPPAAPAALLAHDYAGDGDLTWSLCSADPGADDAATIDARVRGLGLGTATADGDRVRVALAGVATDPLHRSWLEEELFRRRGVLTVGPSADPDAALHPGGRTPALGRTVVDNQHIASARVVASRGNPPVNVLVELDEAGRTALGIWTTTHVLERLVILVDGRLHSAPVVREPITSGRLVLMAGDAREARGLALALGAAPLSGTWTLCAPSADDGAAGG